MCVPALFISVRTLKRPGLPPQTHRVEAKFSSIKVNQVLDANTFSLKALKVHAGDLVKDNVLGITYIYKDSAASTAPAPK